MPITIISESPSPCPGIHTDDSDSPIQSNYIDSWIWQWSSFQTWERFHSEGKRRHSNWTPQFVATPADSAYTCRGRKILDKGGLMTLISRREAGKLVGKVMVGGSTAVILGGKIGRAS